MARKPLMPPRRPALSRSESMRPLDSVFTGRLATLNKTPATPPGDVFGFHQVSLISQLFLCSYSSEQSQAQGRTLEPSSSWHTASPLLSRSQLVQRPAWTSK